MHLESKFGTHVQCRSQKFQKTVIYLSEICQKTVIYKKQSENSKKCVRYQSENCQLQISVRTLLEKIYKCIRNVSDFINESENCLFICKTVRILSEISLLTDFRHIYKYRRAGDSPTDPVPFLKFVFWCLKPKLG